MGSTTVPRPDFDLYAEVRRYLVHGVLARRNLDEYAAFFAAVVPGLTPPAPPTAEPVSRVDTEWYKLPDERLTDVLTHVGIARAVSLRRHGWLTGAPASQAPTWENWR